MKAFKEEKNAVIFTITFIIVIFTIIRLLGLYASYHL